MRYDIETLYALLPAHHRIRDHHEGEPLKEFLSLIAEQLEALEEDIDQSYDNLFIETCSLWAVPYIGDLIAYRLIHGVEGEQRSSRSEVANTIRFRRRKGTVAVLEELARNLTGLDSAAVEYFRRLATTQHLNHLRPDHHTTVDLRRMEPLERLNTAFDATARTAELRNIASGRGKHNIPNIGIFLWRLGQQRWTTVRAQPAVPGDRRRFLFHPLGVNTPLFTLPDPEVSISQLSGPENVPMPLSRRELHRRPTSHYGLGRAFTLLRRPGPGMDLEEIPVQGIVSCHLGDLEANPDTSDWPVGDPALINIDPELGRIRFPDDQTEVYVIFHYAFSARMGGGEYGRLETLSTRNNPYALYPSATAATLQDAIDTVQGEGVVELHGAGPYVETPQIHCVANSELEIRSQDQSRSTLVLDNDLVISGDSSSELTLNGLLIAGGRLIVPAMVNGQPNRLQRIRLVHCTLVPGISLHRDNEPTQAGSPSIVVECPDTELEIEWSITGSIRTVPGASARIENSIIDATDETLIAYAAPAPNEDRAGGPLSVRGSTIVGKLHTRAVGLISNSVLHAATTPGDGWDAAVITSQRQQGCVRFSYVPADSIVPRRYRCLPAPETPAGTAGRPQFVASRYNQPAYMQIAAISDTEFRTAADDRGEIGAFHHLNHTHHDHDLRIRLAEYLRVGLEAGIFYSN